MPLRVGFEGRLGLRKTAGTKGEACQIIEIEAISVPLECAGGAAPYICNEIPANVTAQSLACQLDNSSPPWYDPISARVDNRCQPALL